MTILARLSAFQAATSTVMYATVDISYKDTSGVWQTIFGHQFTDITTPNFLTALLINQAIRDRIATYLNTVSGAGTSNSGLSVSLAGGFQDPIL